MRKSPIYGMCITAGVTAGVVSTCLMCGVVLPPHPNAGDGILALLFLMVLIPVGIIGGILWANLIQKRRVTPESS